MFRSNKHKEATMAEVDSIWLRHRGNVRPSPIKSDQPLVVVTASPTEGALPLTLTPIVPGVNLFHWVKNNRSAVNDRLHRYGGILFRGFGLREEQDLAKFTEALGLELMHYVEGATPRTLLTEHVYTSTEFSPDHVIAPHNELSYVSTWPMRICFMCLQPSETGGETPVADMRKVFKRIPPEIHEEFRTRKWMLVRNYIPGFGLSWERAFRTSSRQEVEEYCRENRIAFEWKSDQHLQTSQVRPATAIHPVTGEPVWFNHIAFWHVSSLHDSVRDLMLSEFGERGLPYNTFYGDGSPIPSDVIEQIWRCWTAETLKFAWQKGDLLLLDNMLVSHARNSYTGQRRVVVSMGDPFVRTEY
jgi:alpha-ketoglutarate-dependent taurine dioxygenase